MPSKILDSNVHKNDSFTIEIALSLTDKDKKSCVSRVLGNNKYIVDLLDLSKSFDTTTERDKNSIEDINSNHL